MREAGDAADCGNSRGNAKDAEHVRTDHVGPETARRMNPARYRAARLSNTR